MGSPKVSLPTLMTLVQIMDLLLVCTLKLHEFRNFIHIGPGHTAALKIVRENSAWHHKNQASLGENRNKEMHIFAILVLHSNFRLE